MKNGLEPNQTGFVSGIGTSVNILLSTERLRNTKKRSGEGCIFIEYKSAYNTVNHQLLYTIMKKKTHPGWLRYRLSAKNTWSSIF